MLSNSLLNLDGNPEGLEVAVFNLDSDKDVPQALHLLKQRKIIILQLSRLAPAKARCVVDWMAGGTLAIDGHTCWLGERTFLFVPRNVQINTQHKSPASISPWVEPA